MPTPKPSPAQPNRVVWIGLLLLSLAALGMRLHGLERFLPHYPEPDSYLVDEWRLIESGVINTALESRLYGKYPHLLPRLAQCLPRAEPPAAGAGTAEHLQFAAAPLATLRLLVALLASLAVPATFLLAKRFLSSGWSLVAACLVATSLLHLGFSQQARPHAPEGSLALIAVLAAMLASDRRGSLAVLWAGCAAGLAIGCLHNGAFVLPPLALALWLGRDNFAQRAKAFLLAAVPIGLLGLFTYPFLIPSLRPYLPFAAENKVQLGTKLPHRAFGQSEWFDGGGVARVLNSLWGWDPTLLILTGLGTAMVCAALWRGRRGRAELASAGKQRRQLAIALAFALPYLLVLCLFQRTFERFLIPLLPYLALLAAFGLQTLTKALGGSKPVALTVALAALTVPSWIAGRATLLRGREDTTQQMAAWLESNLDRTDLFLVNPLILLPLPIDLPQPQAGEGSTLIEIHRRMPWFRHLRSPRGKDLQSWSAQPMDVDLNDLPTKLGDVASRAKLRRRIRQSGAQWVLLTVRPGQPMYELFAEVLQRMGQRVQRISPLKSPAQATSTPTYSGDRMARLTLELVRLGPTFDIYSINPPSAAADPETETSR